MTSVGIAGFQHRSEFNLFVGFFLAATKISTAHKDEVSIPGVFAILLLSALLRASQRPCPLICLFNIFFLGAKQ